MYQAYALLQPETDFTFDVLVTRLQAKFPQMTVTRKGDTAMMASAEWEIHFNLNAEPTVLEESADIAEKIGGDEDGAEIAKCSRRVEVASDIPDPFMEFFSNFQGVIEVLQSFKGVIAVDPREPCLM